MLLGGHPCPVFTAGKGSSLVEGSCVPGDSGPAGALVPWPGAETPLAVGCPLFAVAGTPVVACLLAVPGAPEAVLPARTAPGAALAGILGGVPPGSC